MAKIILITCDRCGTQHSAETPVRLTTVVGAGSARGRIDLCKDCRVAVCEFAGYTTDEARAIVDAHESRARDDNGDS